MLVSREEAKERGVARYFTGKPCKHGHVAARYMANGECVVCAHARVMRWKKTEKGKGYHQHYRHIPKMRKYRREYDRKRYLDRKASPQSN